VKDPPDDPNATQHFNNRTWYFIRNAMAECGILPTILMVTSQSFIPVAQSKALHRPILEHIQETSTKTSTTLLTKATNSFLHLPMINNAQTSTTIVFSKTMDIKPLL